MPGEIEVRIEDDAVLVSGPKLHNDRRARLFFDSVLVADRTPQGWRCPRRRESLDVTLVAINRWLSRNGWAVKGIGEAGAILGREAERRASFERTLEAARQLRDGNVQVDRAQVKASLQELGWNEQERALKEHQWTG